MKEIRFPLRKLLIFTEYAKFCHANHIMLLSGIVLNTSKFIDITK